MTTRSFGTRFLRLCRTPTTTRSTTDATWNGEPIAPDSDLARDGITTLTNDTDTFGFHALAIEDAERFGQRPKLDPYDEVTVLVLYGANQGSDLVEVHCFCAERFLVTIHGAGYKLDVPREAVRRAGAAEGA